MALVDTDGYVVAQYQYEPYGNVAAADDLSVGNPPPTNRLGHQGLFFERFYLDPADTLSDPALTPGAVGLYQNRNRWYSPAVGRLTSMDPKATAMPIVTAMAYNAEALDTLLGAFNAAAHYGDGMNLYGYLGANPVNRLDALGAELGNGRRH